MERVLIKMLREYTRIKKPINEKFFDEESEKVDYIPEFALVFGHYT